MPAATSLAVSSAKFLERSVLNAFLTISSILDCKTAREHSPFGGALLDSKDLTLNFHGKPSYLIGNSFEINLDYDIGTNWRAACRKYKRTMLAHVAAAAFSLSRLAVAIGPPKCNCGLQQKPERLSRWPYKIQQAPPPISRIAH
jgi:hypothetical protein